MKKAVLVCVSLMTRVIVDENATDEEIMIAAKPQFIEKIQLESLDNLESIEPDEEIPFGELQDDWKHDPKDFELTAENISRALKGDDFWLKPGSDDMFIIEKATKLGYVRRISHTQAERTEKVL